MSNAKHTPGPWQRISNKDDRTYRIESSGETVVLFPIMGGLELEENEANARLIAAAPELLACLIAVRSADVEGLAHIDIDAAIAKATGD